MKTSSVSFRFVDAIPENLDDGALYIAMDFATAVHKCCCGCGQEVVTPLSPTDWKLTYDGVSVSLSPSIGNWSFECQSHYFIVRNNVKWAEQWSSEQIEAGRVADRSAKEQYGQNEKKQNGIATSQADSGLWTKLREWLLGK